MQHILITGGSGYLGAELVQQAGSLGTYRVSATYHSHPHNHPDASFFSLDIRDSAATSALISQLRPDLIIHTAYVQSGPDLHRVTVEGAEAVARTAAAVGARLVHLSSDALLDGEAPGRYADSAPAAPVNPYGQAKADAEQRVAALHPAALIARTSLIYGGATPSPHERLVLDALAGRSEVAFFTDEIRCPVHVRDLALALLELAAQPVQGVLNVAGADAVSRHTFACLIATAHGADPSRLRSAQSAAAQQRRPRNCALDSSVAQGLIRTRLRGVHEVFAHRL
ncbi:MAG TPA: sugar nucleotide-binding protein [Roseiflexaceae bacterium]|nr:sugar nucleotide-binding protein [Roseiflexaceae bacterium]